MKAEISPPVSSGADPSGVPCPVTPSSHAVVSTESSAAQSHSREYPRENKEPPPPFTKERKLGTVFFVP